jgi:hypothetical protein
MNAERATASLRDSALVHWSAWKRVQPGYFVSPEEAWKWLVTPYQYTDSVAAIDRLWSGHIEEVVRAAEGANDYQ